MILFAINKKMYKLITAISLVKQISRTHHRRVIILNLGPAISFSNQLHRQFSNHQQYQLVKEANPSKIQFQILRNPTFLRNYLLSLHTTHPNLFRKFNKTVRQLNNQPVHAQQIARPFQQPLFPATTTSEFSATRSNLSPSATDWYEMYKLRPYKSQH
jgi:hypothetical protein